MNEGLSLETTSPAWFQLEAAHFDVTFLAKPCDTHY